MILCSFIILSWIMAAVFWMIPKRLSLADQLILWAIVSFSLITVQTCVSLNLRWVKTSLEPELFLVYLIGRSFLIPIVLLSLANITLGLRTFLLKLSALIAGLGFFFFLEYTNVRIGSITFLKWNYWLSMAVIAGLMLICCYLAHRLQPKAGEQK